MYNSKAIAFPLTGKLSLHEELQERGIAVLDNTEVQRTKDEFVRGYRVPGVLGMFCQVASNPTQAFIAVMVGLAITVAILFTAANARASIIPAIATIAFAGFALLLRFSDADLWWEIRDWGAHWRRSSLMHHPYKPEVWLFNNAIPASINEVPVEANRIINEVSLIPNTKVEVEYCSYDPFIVVRRGPYWNREEAYLYHW